MPYPSPKQLEEIYEARRKQLELLDQKAEIQLADLKDLDRLGRCSVAGDRWAKCTQSVRDALINDEHPHVRSIATLSQAGEQRDNKSCSNRH